MNERADSHGELTHVLPGRLSMISSTNLGSPLFRELGDLLRRRDFLMMMVLLRKRPGMPFLCVWVSEQTLCKENGGNTNLGREQCRIRTRRGDHACH